ncbi:major facilitator superfamily domain-containing protein [Phycomyces nitens]|nr:major facilitator superfamily domain-containing protein [Phycomyces nitens]
MNESLASLDAQPAKNNLDQRADSFNSALTQDSRIPRHQKSDAEKRLVRKLDSRLMLWAFFGYFANGLDRNNMPNAYTNGMDVELNLESDKYNWAITMFFIGYIILQIPANAIITKVRPSIMLPGVVFLWGSIVCFMALVKNYQGLYGLRICLGFSEAAFYPGIVFLLGSWYSREELGTRTAVFVAGSQISGAFSGLISGAIATSLDGAHGMRGWKWLFIIEGLLAVAIGFCGFFLLPDFPHNTRFIVGEERELAIARLERQGKKTMSTGLNMTTFRNLLTTPYVWLFLFIFICFQEGMGILQNFPIILKQMGYTTSFANYMMVPIWVWVAIVLVVQGWLSDHYGRRAWHILVASVWTLIWYIVLVAVGGGKSPVAVLFVSAYMVPPIFGASPIMMTWLNEIYQNDAETRALAIAIVNSLGNLAPNFINLKAWIVTDAPAFYTGKVVTTSMTAFMIVLVCITYVLEQKKILLPKGHLRITTTEIEKREIQEV